MVGRPTQWCGSGRETLPKVRKWLEDSSGGPQVVGDPPRSVEVVRRPCQRFGSGRQTLPEVPNWSVTLPGPRKWSGDPHGSPEEVGDPPEGVEVVGRPSRRSGSGCETLPEIQ